MPIDHRSCFLTNTTTTALRLHNCIYTFDLKYTYHSFMTVWPLIITQCCWNCWYSVVYSYPSSVTFFENITAQTVRNELNNDYWENQFPGLRNSGHEAKIKSSFKNVKVIGQWHKNGLNTNMYIKYTYVIVHIWHIVCILSHSYTSFFDGHKWISYWLRLSRVSS